MPQPGECVHIQVSLSIRQELLCAAQDEESDVVASGGNGKPRDPLCTKPGISERTGVILLLLSPDFRMCCSAATVAMFVLVAVEQRGLHHTSSSILSTYRPSTKFVAGSSARVHSPLCSLFSVLWNSTGFLNVGSAVACYRAAPSDSYSSSTPVARRFPDVFFCCGVLLLCEHVSYCDEALMAPSPTPAGTRHVDHHSLSLIH